MPKHPIQLMIPEPCTQDWNDMAPVAGGRHCSSCRKTVVDFTTISDAEIIAYFRSRPAGTCGQFGAEQLDRILKPAKDESSWTGLAAGLAIAATISSGMQVSNAQAAKLQLPHLEQVPSDETFPFKPALTRGAVETVDRAVSGRVVDVDGLPVQYAAVYALSDTSRSRHQLAQAVTDHDGRYSFTVSLRDPRHSTAYINIYAGRDRVQQVPLRQNSGPICIETRLEQTASELALRELHGEVLDQRGRPITSAHITLLAGKHDIGSELSDFDGQFTIQYRNTSPETDGLTLEANYHGWSVVCSDISYASVSPVVLVIDHPSYSSIVKGDVVIRRRALTWSDRIKRAFRRR